MNDGRTTALVTGGSAGLGRALVVELDRRGWRVVTDARDADRLAVSTGGLPGVVAIPGDVRDPAHRRQLAAAVRGGLDLLVNNASILGPTPQPRLQAWPADALEEVYRVNTFAPLALIQEVLPALRRRGGRVVNVSSDAAVEAYPGWGGYGSAKAALDQLSAVLAVEEPGLRVYAFDPGDMATDLARQALGDEDLTGRPSPESVVPALLRLFDDGRASGRYRAVDLAVPA